MVRTLSGILVWIAVATCALPARAAAPPGAGAVTLELSILSPTIGPIEPLRFRLTLTNRGTETVTDLAPWALRSSTLVEFRAPGRDWQRPEIPFLNRHAGKAIVTGRDGLVLPAGATLTVEMTVVADPSIRAAAEGRRYYFAEPGTYELRASYAARPDLTLAAGPATFRVEAYAGVDAAAYQWLMASSAYPHFVYDFSVYADNSAHATDDEAREILERFPTSRFAPFATLYLARAHLFGIRRDRVTTDPPDPNRAAVLAREVLAAVGAAGARRPADEQLREAAAAVLNEADAMAHR